MMNDLRITKFFKKKTNRVAAILAAAVVLVSAYLVYGNTAVTVSEYDISSDRIPSGFEGFRIVQISDLHITRHTLMTDPLIEKVKELQPDVIFLTGDVIDRKNADVTVAKEVVERLTWIAPVYYVTGNHEARTGDYFALSEKMNKLGVKELKDMAVIKRFHGDEIVIVGLKDPMGSLSKGVTEKADTEKRLSGIEYDREKYTVLLSHRPELFDIYVDNKVDLVFTGHAHGGLIRIPFIGGLYAPHQGFFPRFTSGEYQKDSTTMIVSRGIGNSGCSVRINNQPDLVVVTLHRK